MHGIVVSDFESLIKNIDLDMSNINESYTRLQTAVSNLKTSIGTSSLSFLVEKLNNEVRENRKAINKINAYNLVIRNVLNSYYNQEEAVATAIRSVTP